MVEPLLLQEVERFILKHPLSEGRHTFSGKQIVRATKAGVEHRVAFKTAGAAWMPFSWVLVGLGAPSVSDLRYRPDLATPASVADDDDLACLALWLAAANR